MKAWRAARLMRGLGVAAAWALGMAAAQAPVWYPSLPAGLAPPHVPADNAMNGAKVALGRRLFYDADLSDDGSMACSACHEQRRGFTEGNSVHPGVHGEPARRNVPGLANIAWMRSYTWGDPRVRTLEAQAAIPTLGTDPIEMGMHGREAEIAARLGHDACYRRMFAEAFPDRPGQIDMTTITQALAAFERTLMSFDSPYDRAERGGAPLSAPALEGQRLFAAHCSACHSGPAFSDSRFHQIIPWKANDRGLGEISGKARDDGRFRTPGLRNAGVTAPYFHDGSSTSLTDAITRHRLALDDGAVTALVAFLDALTDRSFLGNPALALPSTACGKPL